jgi:menaquinone-9 beta-reductase
MSSRVNNPDVVVVGAGIAGASIAAVLARGGVEVLLLERQHGYRDRVRGEYMATWGVLEARALGLEDAIRADGRASTVRRQSGIHIDKVPATHVVAGLLVEGASRWPDNEFTPGGVEGDLEFYVFPQGDGRLRLYTCHANEQAGRWAGRAGAQRFVEAFAGLRSIPESRGLGDVTPAGPCGTFSGEQTWCDEPYAEGVVLLGDAGGYDDPVTGQGLSLALRDVRQLSGLLLASGDWAVAALRQYGEQRAERLRRMRRVSKTFAALMTTFTDAGRARRDRFYAASGAGQEEVRMALGALSRGPDRMPSEAFTDELHESLLA